MEEPLRPVDARTLARMLRYALSTGADQMHLSPGHPPLLDGMGGPREIRFRQLTRDDTTAVAGHLLQGARIPERLRDSRADAGQELTWWVELPGEALLEVVPAPTPGGLGLRIDLIRALPEGAVVELAEA